MTAKKWWGETTLDIREIKKWSIAIRKIAILQQAQKCLTSKLNVKNLTLLYCLPLVLLASEVAFAQEQAIEKSGTALQTNHLIQPLEMTLFDQGDIITLYPDNTCSLNTVAKQNLGEQGALWQEIVSKPYLARLSGLAILEQVKQQAQQSRMVIAIDTDDETKLTIQTSENTQNISLYSIDLMHSTYPNAKLLSQFMEIVVLLRKAKLACVA